MLSSAEAAGDGTLLFRGGPFLPVRAFYLARYTAGRRRVYERYMAALPAREARAVHGLLSG